MLTLHPQDFRNTTPTFDGPAHTRLLTALMDRIACGVLACDADGVLLHANNAARRELAQAGPLHLDGRQVRATSAMQDIWCTALFDAAVRQRTRLMALQDGTERLTVALLPVHVEGSDRPAAVAMLGRRNVCSPLGLEMLSSSHGLTYAEQRVLRALVDNSTVREIAASHGVSVTTVRSQIQAVREKLGARSIDALLLQAAALPPVTARC